METIAVQCKDCFFWQRTVPSPLRPVLTERDPNLGRCRLPDSQWHGAMQVDFDYDSVLPCRWVNSDLRDRLDKYRWPELLTHPEHGCVQGIRDEEALHSLPSDTLQRAPDAGTYILHMDALGTKAALEHNGDGYLFDIQRILRWLNVQCRPLGVTEGSQSCLGVGLDRDRILATFPTHPGPLIRYASELLTRARTWGFPPFRGCINYGDSETSELVRETERIAETSDWIGVHVTPEAYRTYQKSLEDQSLDELLLYSGKSWAVWEPCGPGVSPPYVMQYPVPTKQGSADGFAVVWNAPTSLSDCQMWLVKMESPDAWDVVHNLHPDFSNTSAYADSKWRKWQNTLQFGTYLEECNNAYRKGFV